MFIWSLALGFWSFAGEPPATTVTNAAPTPPAFAVLASNVMARSKWERTQNTTAQYAFTRARVFETFDGKDKLTERKQSGQECFPINEIGGAHV